MFGCVCGQAGMFEDSARSGEAPVTLSSISFIIMGDSFSALFDSELHRSEISIASQLCSLMGASIGFASMD